MPGWLSGLGAEGRALKVESCLQGAQGGMANLFAGAQMGSDGGANDGSMSGGLPLSEADGMPSLTGMSPSDAAAFLQSNKKVSPPPHVPSVQPIRLPEQGL